MIQNGGTIFHSPPGRDNWELFLIIKGGNKSYFWLAWQWHKSSTWLLLRQLECENLLTEDTKSIFYTLINIRGRHLSKSMYVRICFIDVRLITNTVLLFLSIYKNIKCCHKLWLNVWDALGDTKDKILIASELSYKISDNSIERGRPDNYILINRIPK